MTKRIEPTEQPGEIERNVSNRIRAARALAGCTLTEMADRCGIGRTYLYELERGGNPTIGILVKIASGTGRPLEWFLQPVATCPTCGQVLPRDVEMING